MAVETKLNLEQETIDALQNLTQVNIDSRDGFREAAEKIDDTTLASMFQKFSDERAQQASELQHFVTINDEEPRRSGSSAASLHQTWMKIRQMFSSNDVHSILAEAERGEDVIKCAYEETLKKTAGSAVNDVLQRHYAAVKATHDRVRDLRDSHKPKK